MMLLFTEYTNSANTYHFKVQNKGYPRCLFLAAQYFGLITKSDTQTTKVMNTCHVPKALANNVPSDVHKGCIFC